jgi:predicted permease
MVGAATGLVLLMACANVAGLLLGRGVVRQRELTLRGALGARRSRIVRQLMTESVILSLAGGAAGLALAAGIVHAAPALVPRATAFGLAAPGLPDVGLDGTVLAFVAGLSVATGLFFGTVPALASSQVDPARVLNDGSPLPAGGFGRLGGNRIQAALAVGQMALAVVFLTAAGLLLRSFVSLVAFDLGFDPTNVVTARAFSPAGFGMFQEGGRFGRDEIEAMNARARGFAEALERQTERIASLPGVEAVALSSSLPLNPASRAREVRVVGRPEPSDPRERLQAGIRRVSPGYADVMRLPLLAGRFFTAADAANAPRVAVVSESFARAAFGGEPPLGRRLRLPDLPFPGPGGDGAEDAETWEIIGVAGDVRLPSRREAFRPDSAGDLYLSMLQPPPERRFALPEDAPAINVRTAGDPAAVVPFLRELLGDVAPGALIDVTALTTVLSVRSAQPRFFAACAGIFGAVALLLAVFGLYGVLSYRVAQRRGEIGVRMALGAGRGDVVMLVVRQGGALVVAGLIVGLLGAAAAARVIESLLYGVPPADPLTFGAVTTVLLAFGLLACWLPARRATRIDPLDTLHDA